MTIMVFSGSDSKLMQTHIHTQEIIELMKQKWKEMSDKEPEAKKQRTETKHREGTCKNCNCYRCCHHI